MKPEQGLAPYRRTSVVRTGLPAYGLFYSSIAVAWGVVALGFVGLTVWTLATSPYTNTFVASLFLAAALLQLTEAYGLLRLYKWSRALALIQATVISAVLGWLLVMLVTLPSKPPLEDVLPTLAMMVAEWGVATGLIIVVVRSWVIDRDLRRSLSQVSNPEL